MGFSLKNLVGPALSVAGAIPGIPYGKLLTAAGSAIGGIAQNAASARAAKEQMDFQREMSDTSYQRAVRDLSVSGINPMLVTKWGGASTPAGAMPSFVNPAAAGSQAFSAQQSSEASMKQAETSERLSKEQVEQIKAATAKIIEETKNIPMEYERLKETVFLLAAQADYYEQLGYTEQKRFDMVKATTQKLISETDLIKFDVQAAEALNNFGRQYKELGPVIQAILSALRR